MHEPIVLFYYQSDQCSSQLKFLLETLSNSRRRRRSGRPEVKIHYWRLLRMRKTKLESSFSSRRLATRVSEVVFGRWVFIHFFCLLSHAVEAQSHFSVFEDFLILIVVDEIGAFYSLNNFLLFYSHGVSWNHDRWKNNVSKHFLLRFMFIWSETDSIQKKTVMSSNKAVN